MKFKSKILFIFLLILGLEKLQAQTSVGVPGWVTVTPPGGVPGGNGQAGDPMAMGTGATWTYTAAWPAYSSTCYYFGYPTTIVGLLNMYNTSPPPPGATVCSGLGNVTYSSGAGTNTLVYTGSTSYHYLNTSWIYTTTVQPVVVTITFTGNAGVTQNINGYI